MSEQPQLYLPPSGASCWTVCTAQPAYVRDHADQIPPDLSTKYSSEGDEAHEVCEALLKDEPVPPFAPADMVKHARRFADFCRSMVDPWEGGQMIVEQKVPLFYMPQRNGKVDCGVLNLRAGEIHVLDMKYGIGIKVEAEGNKQVAIYARSMVEKMSKIMRLNMGTMVHMHIYQPRNGGASTWSVKLLDLMEWTYNNIQQPVDDIMAGRNLRFAPSEDTCRFCPAKSFCSERASHLLDGFRDLDAQITQADLEKPPAMLRGDFLSDGELAYLKVHGNTIKRWIEEVHEYLDSRVATGKMLPGFKLVDGRGQRFWKDERRAEELLKQKLTAEQVTPSKLISPAQAEELLADVEKSTRYNNLFQELIGVQHGKPQLVPESDPRPHYGIRAASDFRDLPAQDAGIDSL